MKVKNNRKDAGVYSKEKRKERHDEKESNDV